MHDAENGHSSSLNRPTHRYIIKSLQYTTQRMHEQQGLQLNGTLSQLKVVEFAAIGPVPLAGMMLADMGAEIVRIDRIPSGDADPSARAGFENRGRSSIALDLKNPRSIEVAVRLIERADVVLEGFRPGVMEKLGLGPEICLERNRALLYARMTGWGQSGPLARAAGHDLNYIALSGALHAMGTADRPPSPPLNLVGDYGGGTMMLMVGVLAALYERQRSGRGQVIDVAMTDGVAALMSPIYSMLSQGIWSDKRDANLLDGGAHFYGVYECADGRFISIGSIEPQFYDLLLRKCDLDVSALPQNEVSSWPKLRERLSELFRSRTRSQWCELLEGTDVCFAPVLSLTEAPQHPHNQARRTFEEVDGVQRPAPAPRFGRTPSRAATQIAREGEHSVQVLAAAGFSQREIAQLLAERAAYSSAPLPLAGQA